MGSAIKKIVDKEKSQDDAIKRQSSQAQKNLNARLDNQRLLNVSGTVYDNMTSRDSTTIYLVNRGSYIELYKGDIPISGEGGLAIENAVYTTALDDGQTLPARFGWEYVGVQYSSSWYTAIADGVPTDYKAYNTDNALAGRFIVDSNTRGLYLPANGATPGGSLADGSETLALTVKRSDGTIETLTYGYELERSWFNLESTGMTGFYHKVEYDYLAITLNGNKIGYTAIVGSREHRVLIPYITDGTETVGLAFSYSNESIDGSGKITNTPGYINVITETSANPLGLLYDIQTGTALSTPHLYGLGANEKAVLAIVTGGEAGDT